MCDLMVKLQMLWLAGYTPVEAQARWGASIGAVTKYFNAWDQASAAMDIKIPGA